MPTGRYTVHRVADDRMPEGHPWAFVEVPGDVPGNEDYMFIVAKSAFQPEMMADAWAAFRHLKFGPATTPVPPACPLRLAV